MSSQDNKDLSQDNKDLLLNLNDKHKSAFQLTEYFQKNVYQKYLQWSKFRYSDIQINRPDPNFITNVFLEFLDFYTYDDMINHINFKTIDLSEEYILHLDPEIKISKEELTSLKSAKICLFCNAYWGMVENESAVYTTLLPTDYPELFSRYLIKEIKMFLEVQKSPIVMA